MQPYGVTWQRKKLVLKLNLATSKYNHSSTLISDSVFSLEYFGFINNRALMDMSKMKISLLILFMSSVESRFIFEPNMLNFLVWVSDEPKYAVRRRTRKPIISPFLF